MHHLDMFHILTMLQIYIIHKDVSERCHMKQIHSPSLGPNTEYLLCSLPVLLSLCSPKLFSQAVTSLEGLSHPYLHSWGVGVGLRLRSSFQVRSYARGFQS